MKSFLHHFPSFFGVVSPCAITGDELTRGMVWVGEPLGFKCLKFHITILPLPSNLMMY